MVNNEKFKFEQVMRGDTKVIILKGIIDEDTSFVEIAKLGGPLVFNFKGITSINSLGIRAWVNFMKEIASVGVTYEECPPIIVRQMNMVPSFVGSATVSSVFVSYVCESCDTEVLKLVTEAEFGSVQETLPCDACKKGELEIDGNPQQYFAFHK